MFELLESEIKISVRGLVEFIFNSGDIDNRTGSSADVIRMQEGARVHRAIQKSMKDSYASEVSLRLSIPIEHNSSYTITIEGRADGIITEEEQDVVIDEIKTVTGDVNKVKYAEYVHKAQAMCYAYIYLMQENLERIRIRVTYCSIDTMELLYFYEDFTREEIIKWFENLLEEFSKWTDFVIDERIKRNMSVKGLEFPFEYRKGQRNLAVNMYKCIKNKENLYIQAPTGTGKTISTIYPSVMAMGEGLAEKIFYLTAKTITRTVAADTFQILKDKGLYFRNCTITARDKVCILEKRDCNPDSCERAKGHFDRINAAVYDLITNELNIDRKCIEEYANKHQVCPFELGLDVSLWCDGIICDYNYVFDPNVRLKRFFADGNKGGYLFLVDESHNLVDRARQMYSASLVKEDFLENKKLVKDMSKKLSSALELCNKDMLAFKRECEQYHSYSDVSTFALHVERAYTLMRKFLDENKHFEKRDELFEFYMKLRHFLNMHDILTDKYIIYSEFIENGDFKLELFCADPSDNVKNCVEQGVFAAFFSATFLPINYYKEMLTADAKEKAVYANSCFDTNNRLLVIADDVTSRYTRRNETEYQKIGAYIEKIVTRKKGNYMVFFPSYKYMADVYETMEKMVVDGTLNFDCYKNIVCQSLSMSEKDKEDFLNRFELDEPVTGFCVLGGVFSEGIDLREDSLIGAVVVGCGLPMVCVRQTILKEYFDETGKNGFDYAYIYPGMNKVMQAAGRVIRTEEDKGIIALLDDRFLRLEYNSTFPREWSDAREVNSKNIEGFLDNFWKSFS